FRTYFHYNFSLVISLCLCRILLPLSCIVRIHNYRPPSYLNDSFQTLTFSMTRNFADLARRFDATSLFAGRIGFFLSHLIGASNRSGIIGIAFGIGLGQLHFLNACLQILSANEWNVITTTLPPIAVAAAA